MGSHRIFTRKRVGPACSKQVQQYQLLLGGFTSDSEGNLRQELGNAIFESTLNACPNPHRVTPLMVSRNFIPFCATQTKEIGLSQTLLLSRSSMFSSHNEPSITSSEIASRTCSDLWALAGVGIKYF
jgi:hypothetical protein